ncbi:MAG: NADPH-dependent oxidoreductase [Actinomycetota bacterium]|nr:MAG: NADPH-dependent oxidoreductase [Actinomycetota bacterium]
MTSISVVTGNPQRASRTHRAAVALADAVAAVLPAAVQSSLDLGDLPLGDVPAVAAAQGSALADAQIVVVASPTYKASYTGLLKVFLDYLPTGSLAGRVVLPLMTVGGPGHSLAAEVHLRPVLVELGALVPFRSLVLTAAELDGDTAPIAAYVDGIHPVLRRLLPD